MLKPIKFNLNVEEYGCRTIDELLEHFNISDVLDLYENGTLIRWLEVRKFEDYAEKVRQIDSSADAAAKAKALLTAFGFPVDDENTQKALYAIQQSKEREAFLQDCAVNSAAADKIIENYLAGYKKLKEDMKAHANDAVFIQSAAETLAVQYKAAFELDGVLFYHEVKKDTPQIAAALEKAFPDMQQVVSSQSYSSEYTALKETMKQHSTDMTILKQIVDKIADNFFIEFEQDYKQFFYEIKDSHPLIVYGLLMNKKTHDCMLSDEDFNKKTIPSSMSAWGALFHSNEPFAASSLPNKKTFADELCAHFVDIPANIDKGCSHYFKECKRQLNFTGRVKENTPVLVISIPIKVQLTQSVRYETYIKRDGKRLFMLLDRLDIKLDYGETILYMKIPETPENKSI